MSPVLFWILNELRLARAVRRRGSIGVAAAFVFAGQYRDPPIIQP